MCEFEKNKRAIFLQEKFYLENQEYAKNKLSKNIFDKKPLAEDGWDLNDPEDVETYYRRMSWDQISEAMEYTQLLYSAGHPMPEVIAATHDMLERFHKHFGVDFPERKLQLWEPDTYAYILWLLGLAVLSNHKPSLERIPNWLAPDLDENGDWIKGGAPLVDEPLKALLDFIGYTGKVQVDAEPFFPKSVYMLIPEIINPTREQGQPSVSPTQRRTELMQQYLRGWYKTSKDTYWYDYHIVRDGELFFGYWSFEAGMLSVLLDLPYFSKPFKEMSFYPKDYVEYARTHGFATLK
ncbi:PoNe immunity protein domain-containing protein [Neisseria sp. 74A18]|uniref:PoNe immunity protein domain-containing protein n=1 Tax=Neisseria sp. 74A18 TaxID=1696094 RepID=UPI0006CAC1DA|nr:PoNe immunity protein domain-containing protein [Neisseria sp. 74A18]KPN73987.1 hypothetical protein AKG43_05310 [Neisseria sp. 74A18]